MVDSFIHLFIVQDKNVLKIFHILMNTFIIFVTLLCSYMLNCYAVTVQKYGILLCSYNIIRDSK